METNDIGHDRKTSKFLKKKFIHYQHHAHSLDVCLSLKTEPKGLEIKKHPELN